MTKSENTSGQTKQKNWLIALGGLGVALVIAGVVSPWASQDPDGLDRVAQDLEFEHRAQENPLAKQLPFAHIFDEYALQGVPETLATPLAGVIGTLVTFGLAWGLGKLVIGGSRGAEQQDELGNRE